jgi:hypothetical protein
MPAPTPPATVTVTDTFLSGGGAPLAGRVSFTPSVTSKTADATIARTPVVARLAVDGSITAVLVATDAPGVTPTGWTYDVVETIGEAGSDGALGVDAWVSRRYSISLPAANPAVVLRALTPVDPVSASMFEVKTVAGVPADVGGNINLTAEDLAMGGIGFVPESEFDAFTATKGQPSGLASLDSGGLIPVAQLPPIALSDYLGPVGSQAAMLALTGQRGDWTIRTDTSSTGSVWVLNAEPSSTLANWTQLPVPAVPVASVAGKTGVVTLVKADVGLSNVDNTSDASKPVSTATTTALSGKANTAHTHAIADVTGLQTYLDDDSPVSPDAAILGDLAASVPRFAATSQDTLSNQFLTIHGAIAMRAFNATKLRFHVRGAVGSPGIVTMALFKGSNRSTLAKVVADTVVTTQFGSTGPKELTISSLSVSKGDWLYLVVLHTNAGTDPAMSTIAGPPSVDLLNPSSTQIITGYKTGQTSIPASTLDATTGWTLNARLAWFALAA